MNTDSKGARDYIAIILVGAGSSYARGPDKADCIERVKRIAVSDWQTLFKLDGEEATVNVVDVTGHDEVWWDTVGVHVKGQPDIKLDVERIRVTLPSLEEAERDDNE
jgi:hypothetical protein